MLPSNNVISTARQEQISPSTVGEVRQKNVPIATGIECWIGPGSGKLTIDTKKEQVVSSHLMLIPEKIDIKENDLVKDKNDRVYKVLLVTIVERPGGEFSHILVNMTFHSGGFFL